MTPADWKDNLAALLAADTLPEGDDIQPQHTHEKELPKPKLSVSLDRKRAGKTATIVAGFDPDDPRAADLAALLKRRLATGGSSRGGEILVQGDRVAAVKNILKEQGYKTN